MKLSSTLEQKAQKLVMGRKNPPGMKSQYPVTQYGSVWLLSRSAVRELLSAIADGRSYDLDSLGQSVRENIIRVLDMTPEEAIQTMKDLGLRRSRR